MNSTSATYFSSRENSLSGIRFRRYSEALQKAWRRLTKEEIECAGTSGFELARLVELRHGIARHVALEHIQHMQEIHL
ncbi:MAG: hypothetical protein K2Q12_03820 [Rickettsiales bacterium]|nr:hypothetical protein [Rickettsiales bacterium]